MANNLVGFSTNNFRGSGGRTGFDLVPITILTK
jgi:nucleoside-triphosphatase THEP1